MDHSDLDSVRQLDQRIIEAVLARDALIQRMAAAGELPTVGREIAALDQTVKGLAEAGPTAMDPRTAESMGRVLRHVASHSRSRVEPTAISFLGPRYSYSHLAAIKYFGDEANFTPVASIPAVFDAVHRGDAKSGLVPIENSTDGRVVDTLGMFVRRHMQICGEVLLPIHHNLLASGSRAEIREIHSKPQALSQCRGWLAANFPSAKLVEVSSTTAAAESAAEHPHVAAVASLPAGRAYGLDVLNRDIEDNAENVTRFAVLGRDEPEATGADKTSLLFQVEHQPGALAGAMTIFSQAELNLTWIESFPSPETRSEYLFFVEFAGHRSDARVASAIEALGKVTRRLDLLGSYPAAVL